MAEAPPAGARSNAAAAVVAPSTTAPAATAIAAPRTRRAVAAAPGGVGRTPSRQDASHTVTSSIVGRTRGSGAVIRRAIPRTVRASRPHGDRRRASSSIRPRAYTSDEGRAGPPFCSGAR